MTKIEGSLGEIMMTRGVAAFVGKNAETYLEIMDVLTRYRSGDWGETAKEDQPLNDYAAANPGSDRIVAKYCLNFGNLLIITEHDRSYTTIMLPTEY